MLVWVVVLIRVNGGRFSLMEWVVGFLLIMMFSWKFFMVGYSIFLMMGERWWILLMNRMLLVFRLVSNVVRLLGCLSIGLEVFLMEMFIFWVMIFVRVVLFSFGGLKISVWLSVFWWLCVVWMNSFICLCMLGWLMQLVSFSG